MQSAIAGEVAQGVVETWDPTPRERVWSVASEARVKRHERPLPHSRDDGAVKACVNERVENAGIARPDENPDRKLVWRQRCAHERSLRS